MRFLFLLGIWLVLVSGDISAIQAVVHVHHTLWGLLAVIGGVILGNVFVMWFLGALADALDLGRG